MPARRVIDLSHPVDPTTPVYPGDPAVRFSPHATVERDGFALLRVEMGSQTGTHVDAPSHVRAGGATIDAVDPALCVGPGVVVDVRHRGAGEAIRAADLTDPDRLGPGVIVALWTGWSRHWGEAAYFDHPYLHVDACRMLLDAGVRTIGLDAPSIDAPSIDAPSIDAPSIDAPSIDATGPEPTRVDEQSLPCHLLVADAGGLVVENLTGLDAVGPDALISVLPLRLTGADGAPVRAVAVESAR